MNAIAKHTENQTLSEALRLADLGYPVVPCNRDKEPLTENGLDNATTDPDQIRQWWTQWPDANLALRSDNLLVIDIDNPEVDWPGNAARADDLTAGPMSTTPRGGSHHYFKRLPEKHWRNSRSKLAPKVDTKTDRGYLLEWPSGTEDGTYRWIQSLDVSAEHLPEPPAWLVAELDKLWPVPPPTAPPPRHGKPVDGRERMALSAMLRMTVADEKDGSKRVLKAACRAVEFDLTDDQAASTMAQYLDVVPAPRTYSRDDLLKRVRDAERDCVRGSALHNGQAIAEKENQVSDAERLVRIALERYRIGRTDSDEAFAVSRDGLNIAVMFRGSSDALRAKLAQAFRREHKRTPGTQALADSLTCLRGEAYDSTPEPVALRLAEHEGATIIDLGDQGGTCVAVSPGSWEVLDKSPVLFRRTALTSPLPVPERGGDLDELRALLNVSAESWPMLVGWIIAAYILRIPHPILCLRGLQGAGKTCAARMLIHLIDPSSAPLRSPPKEPEAWALTAAGSWCVCIDNVSSIPSWWSDQLCKTVTGDGWVRRRLYTDGELSVVSYRRVVALTAIDAGALRGDLADRLLLIELDRIADGSRREERELDALFDMARPRLFGAVLDLLANVLKVMPKVKLTSRPRMADFARVLAALDMVNGSRALTSYTGQRDTVAAEVVEDDPVGAAVKSLAERGKWNGTATELLNLILPERPGKEWPRTPRALSGRLRRIAPALLALDVAVDFDREGHGRTRTITVSTVRNVRNGPVDNENADDADDTDAKSALPIGSTLY